MAWEPQIVPTTHLQRITFPCPEVVIGGNPLTRFASTVEMTCFPDHSAAGFQIVGGSNSRLPSSTPSVSSNCPPMLKISCSFCKMHGRSSQLLQHALCLFSANCTSSVRTCAALDADVRNRPVIDQKGQASATPDCANRQQENAISVKLGGWISMSSKHSTLHLVADPFQA